MGKRKKTPLVRLYTNRRHLGTMEDHHAAHCSIGLEMVPKYPKVVCTDTSNILHFFLSFSVEICPLTKTSKVRRGGLAIPRGALSRSMLVCLSVCAGAVTLADS